MSLVGHVIEAVCGGDDTQRFDLMAHALQPQIRRRPGLVCGPCFSAATANSMSTDFAALITEAIMREGGGGGVVLDSPLLADAEADQPPGELSPARSMTASTIRRSAARNRN